MTSWPSITKCNQLVLGIKVIHLIHPSLWDQECRYPCFEPGGAVLSTREETATLATLAWFSNVINTKVLFRHFKKIKKIHIWSMAEVFSATVLHLPRLSYAFASTPGCESCAWSVNVKTSHYGAGRLFWTYPGSCKICALIQLVNSFNFSIFNLTLIASLLKVFLISHCWEECL